MKIKQLYFRGTPNLDRIKKIIKRLFYNLTSQLNSEYLIIQIYFKYSENEKPIPMGETFIINLESFEERRFYVDYIVNKYEKMVGNNLKNDLKILKCLVVHFSESDSVEHAKFLKNSCVTLKIHLLT